MDNMDTNHWTEESPLHFRYNIAHNFVAQIETKLDDLNMTHNALAEKLGVSKSRVSRVFSDPGNLTLDTVIRWCRALAMKPAIVVYEDATIPDRAAPIHPDVFVECWKKEGCPVDFTGFQPAPKFEAADANLSNVTKKVPSNGNFALAA